MKTNKKELLKKLELVKPGVSNKEIIEFTDSFSFTGDSIMTFNDSIFIKIPFESEIKGTVKADKFHKIIKKTGMDKEGFITIIQKDNELIIKGKKGKYGISFDPEGTLPLEEIKIPKKFKKIPDDFTKGIKFSLFCVSNDTSTPLLNCINVLDGLLISSN